jgi:hypothetical protein
MIHPEHIHARYHSFIFQYFLQYAKRCQGRSFAVSGVVDLPEPSLLQPFFFFSRLGEGFVGLFDIMKFRRSIGVIQPSLCEGWSTVVEDIRALAKPSILSNLPVHIEQNPAKSHFFDRNDPDSLFNAITKAWSEWKPGPNLNEEELARIDAKQRIKMMGKNFIAIINETMHT